MTKALENTEKIRAIFQATQAFCAANSELPALTEYLGRVEKDFSSIAYESASMSVALAGFERGTFPRDWLLFSNGAAAAHRAQVYVGLGWAVAKANFPYATAVSETDARFASRVADGCGYYDGTFRRRQTVINQHLPVYLPVAAAPMYDQGLGRSLWYSEKADVQKTRSAVEAFVASRQADLWRGVGLAVAYVGGCEDADLKLLLRSAGANALQLAVGAALAVKSRTMANTLTADTDRCARLWFGLTAGAGAAGEEKYREWISG